jgi:hypothetical protein
MKLYLLRPIHKEGDDPWDPWYDKAFGFVVRAEDEKEARELAHGEAGDENRGEFMQKKIADTDSPWLSKKYSTCKELTIKGKKEIVITDFARA